MKPSFDQQCKISPWDWRLSKNIGEAVVLLRRLSNIRKGRQKQKRRAILQRLRELQAERAFLKLSQPE